jgi:hypothetical protein
MEGKIYYESSITVNQVIIFTCFIVFLWAEKLADIGGTVYDEVVGRSHAGVM